MRTLTASLIWLLLPTTLFAQNFVGAPKIYLDRAEQARKDLAIFWTGKELPGNWAKPCHITVNEYPPGSRHEWDTGGGATNFNFDSGHVFNWSMTVEGPRKNLLESVIPHEVNHMIFASLVRHPITRWLDEGCSTLFESEFEHERYRNRTLKDSNRYGTMLKSLDASEYASSMEETMNVYAAGFTLVEWMLEQQGKDTLLAFVKDPDLPSVKMKKHYGMNSDAVLMGWNLWVRDRGAVCSDAKCRFHSHRFVAKPLLAVNGQKPILWIVGAPWCIRCKPFEFDYSLDQKFKEELQEHYIVSFVNGDVNRAWMQSKGVTSYPTFVVSNGTQVLVGYPGKRNLLSELSKLVPGQSQPITPTPGPVEAQPPNSTFAFDQEKFSGDLMDKVGDMFKGRESVYATNLATTITGVNESTDEKFSTLTSTIEENQTTTDDKLGKVITTVDTAAKIAKALGIGVPASGVLGLGLMGINVLLKRRQKRKQGSNTEEDTSNLLPIDREPNDLDQGTVYQQPGKVQRTDSRDYVLTQENDKLRQVIKEMQNEMSKVREYIQVPIESDTELYRRALDIVVKTHHASPQVQQYHKEVEEHYVLQKSGRGV